MKAVSIHTWSKREMVLCKDEKGHRWEFGYGPCEKCGMSKFDFDCEPWDMFHEFFQKAYPPNEEDLEILKQRKERNALWKLGSGMFCPDPEPEWVDGIKDGIRSVESSIDALNPKRRGF